MVVVTLDSSVELYPNQLSLCCQGNYFFFSFTEEGTGTTNAKPECPSAG
jgi:hypothetical protein